MRVILAGLALLVALMAVPWAGGNGVSPAAECPGPGCYVAGGPNGGHGRSIGPAFCPNGGCAAFEPTGGRPADVAPSTCGTSGGRADSMA